MMANFAGDNTTSEAFAVSNIENKVTFWSLHSSPYSYHLCLRRHLKIWMMGCMFSQDKMLTSLMRSGKNKMHSSVRELLFADDGALVSHSPGKFQRLLNTFSDAPKKIGLKINI